MSVNKAVNDPHPSRDYRPQTRNTISKDIVLYVGRCTKGRRKKESRVREVLRNRACRLNYKNGGPRILVEKATS